VDIVVSRHVPSSLVPLYPASCLTFRMYTIFTSFPGYSPSYAYYIDIVTLAQLVFRQVLVSSKP